MEAHDGVLGSDAGESKPHIAPKPRSLTAAHLEPWRGNIIDVTMIDGSHRIGLLDRMEEGVARLRAVAGFKNPDGGSFRIADAMRLQRASRN
jgi:hypothetical protein